MADKLIRVGSKTIGGERTFLIADVGSNHNQELQLAFDSIDAARESGADAVKFQSLQMEKLYYSPGEDVKNLYAQIDLEEKWHYDLKNYCDKKDIIFFSSPTYFQAVDILEEAGAQLYKLASAQIGTFPQIVERVAKTGKPIILSTGLVSYGELERSVRAIKAAGNEKLVILHCNSIYPTPYHRVNLKLLNTYQQMFDCLTGFSDHTNGSYVALAAVSIGAKVIEKHFTLSRGIATPDAATSMEPAEFKHMSDGVRAVEQALRSEARIEIQPEENAFKESLRYRLVLAKDKRAGDNFTPEDFQYLRHTSGVDCRDADFVFSHFKLKTNLTKGALLEWSMLEGK